MVNVVLLVAFLVLALVFVYLFRKPPYKKNHEHSWTDDC